MPAGMPATAPPYSSRQPLPATMNNIRALCLAERFQFDALYEFLSHQTHATRMRNVIALSPDEGVRAFLFDYGVCVLFQYDYESEKRLIDQVRKYAINPLDTMVEEELEYQKSSEGGIRIRNDLIEVDDLSQLTCLSLGHALAQSTKLASFEASIEETIKKTKYIPETLASKGSIAMSRRNSPGSGAGCIWKNRTSSCSSICSTPLSSSGNIPNWNTIT